MFRRLLIVLLLIVGVSHCSIASDTIYVSHLQGDLVAALRPMVSKRATDSRLVIYFDKPGVYEWSGTVESRCHTEIIGLGAETTVLEFQHGRDRAGFKAFLDDAFINVKGSADSPVEVGIRDVAFRIKEHQESRFDPY